MSWEFPWSYRAALVLTAAVLTLPLPAAEAQNVSARLQLPPLSHTSVAFDASRSRLVVYGGLTPGNRDLLNGTWEWDGSRWRQVADSVSSPPRRDGATMGYDPDTRQLFLFGGWLGNPWSGGAFTPFCDTWTFDGKRWTRRNNGSCVTDRVRNNSLVYDARRRAMLLVDGTPEIPPADTRRLRLWRWSNGSWILVDSSGPRRSGWDQAVYDERRDVVVIPVFDGPDAGVWEWDGAGWRSTPLSSLGPTPRHVYGLAYDARLGGVVMVGGQSYSRPRIYYDDVWVWDGSRWTEVPRHGDAAPIARAGAALVSDAANGRLLYFGGYRAVPPLQDLWQLDARGWRLWTAPSATSTRVHGIFKAGFFVPDLDSALVTLRERRIPIEGQWLQSRPRNLMVRDNSGNLIQFIERRP